MIRSDVQSAYRLLHQGMICLSKVEAAGVRVNHKYLVQMMEHTQNEINRLEKEMRTDPVYKVWRRAFGAKTNVGAYEQLAHVLFKVMGYKPKLFTDKSVANAGGDESQWRPRTDSDALEDIDLPFVRKFQKVQNHKKTLSTYLLGIRRELVKTGGHWWVHPIYNLHTAVSFRSSCDNPNFQNIPKRNPEMAKLIRPCYMPHPGHRMVEIDFGQLEVRVAACYTNDPTLMKYIKDPTTDMHRDVAEQIFKVPHAEMMKNYPYYKKTIRDATKNMFVFPEFYGSVFFNCAENIWKAIKKRDFRYGGKDGPSMFDYLADHGIKELGKSQSMWTTDKSKAGTGVRTGRIATEAGTFMDHLRGVEEDFWEKRFRVYTKWKRSWWDEYQRTGEFAMHSGFRVAGVFKKNDVINYPIQGAAFHCLLWCMIQIQKWLDKYRMKSCIIGEIHDSLILSVHPKEVQAVLKKCHEVMTHDLLEHWDWINVPMEIEAEVGEVDADWTTVAQWTPNQAGTWELKA